MDDAGRDVGGLTLAADGGEADCCCCFSAAEFLVCVSCVISSNENGVGEDEVEERTLILALPSTINPASSSCSH